LDGDVGVVERVVDVGAGCKAGTTAMAMIGSWQQRVPLQIYIEVMRDQLETIRSMVVEGRSEAMRVYSCAKMKEMSMELEEWIQCLERWVVSSE